MTDSFVYRRHGRVPAPGVRCQHQLQVGFQSRQLLSEVPQARVVSVMAVVLARKVTAGIIW